VERNSVLPSVGVMVGVSVGRNSVGPRVDVGVGDGVCVGVAVAGTGVGGTGVGVATTTVGAGGSGVSVGTGGVWAAALSTLRSNAAAARPAATKKSFFLN
jgi:hypothetical protein